jgi:hypothetical protein
MSLDNTVHHAATGHLDGHLVLAMDFEYLSYNRFPGDAMLDDHREECLHAGSDFVHYPVDNYVSVDGNAGRSGMGLHFM